MRERNTAIRASHDPGAFGSGASAPTLVRFPGRPHALPDLVNALGTGSRLATDERDGRNAIEIVRAFQISVARASAFSVF